MAETTEQNPKDKLSGIERRLANLRPPWKEGIGGNPHKKNLVGRPKIADRLERWGKLNAPEVMRQELKKLFPKEDFSELDLDDVWTLKVVYAAVMGESWAVEFIANRREGAIRSKLEDLKPNTAGALHELSDDELDRRLSGAQNRIARAPDGEGTPPLSP